MFYPIITTLDGGGTGGMAGINKNVTHTGSVLSNHNNFGRGRGGVARINKNVTHAGINKNVTHAGKNKNVTHAGSQLTF